MDIIILSILIGIISYFFYQGKIGTKRTRSFFLEKEANRLFNIAHKHLEEEIDEAYKNKDKGEKSLTMTYEEIFEDSKKFKEEVMSINKMKTILLEKYQHDIDTKFQVAIDWYNYAHLFYEVQPSLEAMGVLTPNLDKLDENYIKRQEISKRLKKMLENK